MAWIDRIFLGLRWFVFMQRIAFLGLCNPLGAYRMVAGAVLSAEGFAGEDA